MREAQARITSREFAEWMAFERVYGPLDTGRRIDVAAAIVASTLANIHRDSKQQPFTVEDFLPDWDPAPQRRQTPEETVRLVEMLNAAFGGKDERLATDDQ